MLRCFRVFVSLALLLEVQSARAAFDLRRAANDPCVLRGFSDLLRDAATFGRNAELGAFLTSDDDGKLRLLTWPATDQRLQAFFRGQIPAGTVAIVHTHPPSKPKPSSGDVEVARRTALPVLVITVWRLWAADPVRGEKIELIGRSNWTYVSREGSCEARFARSTLRTYERHAKLNRP